MRIMIYLTTDGAAGMTPVLYVEDKPETELPEHPNAGAWSYFATVDAADPIIGREHPDLHESISRGAPYVSPHLPLGLSSQVDAED